MDSWKSRRFSPNLERGVEDGSWTGILPNKLVHKERSKEQLLKASWHLLLVAAAVIEFRTSKTSFRRLLVGACAGWHVAAALDDWES